MLDTPEPVQGDLLAFLNEQEEDEPGPTEGTVQVFSRASKRRLGRAIAKLDWADAINPGERLALITLTYPDLWRQACTDPDKAYAQLRALEKRYNRATEGKLKGVWKREFQKRGAPHFHILSPLPAFVAGKPVREWFAQAWYEVVGSGDERHQRAGTGIDWSEGLRMMDANRAAAYFTGYSAGKTGHKSYQDQAPVDWANRNGSVGRWWGVIGMEQVTAETRITETDVIQTKRLLRGVLNAQKRTKQTTVRRVDRRTGEIYYRKVNRRYQLSSLRGGAKAGCTFLTNDGPSLAIAVARALDQTTRPWTPGERRPLP